MKTALTTAQRSLISLIVDTAIDVSLQGEHSAKAEYLGISHAVFVQTCADGEQFSAAGKTRTAWLARYADEDEQEHAGRVNSELAALYDHLTSLLPGSQS
ncbi:hypothetical protein [Chromohalobacter moromii]|uniref:Uncharacterized protein n=1 Tax=Chromohalobacter moromii TaxID=2860329 RepID=A0A9X3B6X7_9GAMM|nr:hypothetical protein [Chromohalobacter moromii]MCT8506173.1 hypothetical protein [Chromohalobacter moromii]